MAIRVAAIALGALGVLSLTAFTGEIKVSQKGKTFAPGDVSAKVGATVVFVNDDNVPHNVFSKTSGADFNLGVMKPGEEQRVTLTSKGTFQVACAIHPKMKLSITVE